MALQSTSTSTALPLAAAALCGGALTYLFMKQTETKKEEAEQTTPATPSQRQEGPASGALARCPATAWPAGKPIRANPSVDYPLYDHVSAPAASFTAVCDMLIKEISGTS